MSDRSFRDRLARIADNIDLEQLDGLIVNRIEPNYSTEEDQPSLQRLFLGLEDNQSLPPSAVSPPVVMNEVNLIDKKFIKISIGVVDCTNRLVLVKIGMKPDLNTCIRNVIRIENVEYFGKDIF